MEKIGVSLWLGESPFWIRKALIHNSMLFDKFYLISDSNELMNEGNIKTIDIECFNKWVIKNYGDVSLPGAAQMSDILCYFAKRIMKEAYDIKVDGIMCVDADYIIYNRFLLNEIFSKGSRFHLKDQAVRIDSLGNEYFNTAVSMDCDANYDEEVTPLPLVQRWKDLKDIIEAEIEDYLTTGDYSHYTQIGPHLINGSELEEFKILYRSKIGTISIQPGILTSGENKFDLKPECLGVHVTQSHFKPLGFIVSGWSLRDGKFLLNIHDKINV